METVTDRYFPPALARAATAPAGKDKAAVIARFAATVMPLVADGSIAPVLDRVFPLAAVAAAHARMESSAHFGKIVLSMSQ